jgi:recombination protein RecT
VLVDGGGEFEVLSVAEVEAIRARSRAAKGGPWVTDWDAMARKTAVRQLAKWLPMATVLHRAIAAEGQVRTELDADVLDTFEDTDVIDEPGGEQNDTVTPDTVDAAGTEDTPPPAEEVQP